MKLFIWNRPYDVNYGGSIIYALAETIEEAREQAMKAPLAMFGLEPLPLNEGSTWAHKFTLGEPDRVLEGPCAELYEWSE